MLNAGREGTFDGPLDRAEGRAWVSDASEPAKLRVSFFEPFAADYRVIVIDPEYC